MRRMLLPFVAVVLSSSAVRMAQAGDCCSGWGHGCCSSFCSKCWGFLSWHGGWMHDYDACGCHWPGEYKWPVPPYYTYHWPGQYAGSVVGEYTPLRFEPLSPPPQPVDVTSVKYQVRESFRRSMERLRNPDDAEDVAPRYPFPSSIPSNMSPQRFESQPSPIPGALPSGQNQAPITPRQFGAANRWPGPMPGQWQFGTRPTASR